MQNESVDSSSYFDNSMLDCISQEVEQGFKNNVATIIKPKQRFDDAELIDDASSSESGKESDSDIEPDCFDKKKFVMKNPKMAA